MSDGAVDARPEIWNRMKRIGQLAGPLYHELKSQSGGYADDKAAAAIRGLVSNFRARNSAVTVNTLKKRTESAAHLLMGQIIRALRPSIKNGYTLKIGKHPLLERDIGYRGHLTIGVTWGWERKVAKFYKHITEEGEKFIDAVILDAARLKTNDKHCDLYEVKYIQFNGRDTAKIVDGYMAVSKTTGLCRVGNTPLAAVETVKRGDVKIISTAITL